MGLASRGRKLRRDQFSWLAIVKRTVDIFELAGAGAQVDARIAIDRMPRLASLLARSGGELSCVLRGHLDERGRAAAVLRLRGVVGLTCDRCSAPLDWMLEADASFYFVAGQVELDAVPITAEGDEPLVGSRQFDWWELAEDQAILSLPISPRHPHCAAAPPPAADGDGARRPFAVLETLKKGGSVVK
jgi:uncharacterized protein